MYIRHPGRVDVATLLPGKRTLVFVPMFLLERVTVGRTRGLTIPADPEPPGVEVRVYRERLTDLWTVTLKTSAGNAKLVSPDGKKWRDVEQARRAALEFLRIVRETKPVDFNR